MANSRSWTNNDVASDKALSSASAVDFGAILILYDLKATPPPPSGLATTVSASRPSLRGAQVAFERLEA